jgi:hypothetical protein
MKLVCVVPLLLLDSTLDHGNKQHQTRLKTMVLAKDNLKDTLGYI